MKHTLLVPGMAVTLALAGAVPAFASGKSCLQIGSIYNWKALNNKSLMVEDNSHNKFKLGLMGYCPSLPFKQTLGFKAIGGASSLSRVTPGDQIFFHDTGMALTCTIQSVTPYTAEMEKADKAAKTKN